MMKPLKDFETKKFFIYLFRWQLSTPILTVVLIWMAAYNKWAATIVANLIGGIIFFWVDKYIFSSNYDRTRDKNSEFRCEVCSKDIRIQPELQLLHHKKRF